MGLIFLYKHISPMSWLKFKITLPRTSRNLSKKTKIYYELIKYVQNDEPPKRYRISM